MSEETPTEITCPCGYRAIVYDTLIEKDGKVWNAVYRCLRCGIDTYCREEAVMHEDIRGLRILFGGDAG